MLKTLARSTLLLAAAVTVSTLFGAGSPAQAQEPQFCIRASQCHGILPLFCIQCSNGQFACPHWACVRHRCVVQTCPGNRVAPNR
jgi:hypothetical protein